MSLMFSRVIVRRYNCGDVSDRYLATENCSHCSKRADEAQNGTATKAFSFILYYSVRFNEQCVPVLCVLNYI